MIVRGGGVFDLGRVNVEFVILGICCEGGIGVGIWGGNGWWVYGRKNDIGRYMIDEI